MVNSIFPSPPERIERVPEGMSTFVYRIIYKQETFYLRIFPEPGESFAPEVAIRQRLYEMEVKVPQVIYYEACNPLLERPLTVVTEIPGRPLSKSPELERETLEALTREAGRDLARINGLRVEGFGWLVGTDEQAEPLRGELPDHRSFAQEHWESDLAFLAHAALNKQEIKMLEQALVRYASRLDVPQAYLAHGDLDTTHIFQHQGRYMGIIDFGEIRGASQWYDLGHFHMRDGENSPYALLLALLQGYAEITPLTSSSEQHIRFNALLINVRALSNSLQKRPPNRYTQHQVQVLRADLAALLHH